MQKNKIIDKINYAKQYSAEVYAKTKKYQKQYGFELGTGKYDTWDNEADAFKHTFGAAEIAIKTTLGISKVITDFHEFQQRKNPYYEENMDKWNNYEGRKIAQEIKATYSKKEIKDLIAKGKMDDIIAEKVMERMNKGDLITNPYTDNRMFDEKSLKDKIFNIKNGVFHKGEMTMKDLENPIMRDVYLDQAMEKQGLPSKETLDNQVLTGGLIYVKEYVRSDGTKVSGYYRSYPEN